MARHFLAAACLAFVGSCAHGDSEGGAPRLSAADIAPTAGAGWKGSLVYRDYSPPQGEVTLAVEADIAVVPGGLSLTLRYPDEPGANSTDVLALSKDGARFGGDPVIDRRAEGGAIVATTRAPCRDDDRPATCEHLYRFGAREFAIEKRDRFDGETAFIRRNAYRLTR